MGADEIQRDNDMTIIEHHLLNRLGNVEHVATELVKCSIDGCI
jgi:hypothetical protein